jgi:acyl-CoA thioesterase-1
MRASARRGKGSAAYSLPNLTESLKKQRKIRIVAIGSSSTAGEADVLPYPSRLEMLLRDRVHDRMIDVLNRGIGGQEAPSELLRFETDVVVEAPALVRRGHCRGVASTGGPPDRRSDHGRNILPPNAADDADVNVFRRFALMREWADHQVPMKELVRDGDQLKLHMSDWATHCVTAALFRSIRRAVEAAGAT